MKLISDEDREIYSIVNSEILSSLICCFGIVANIMNMIVFYKQGFASTMNISFFGLAISDLCSLLTQLFCVVFFNPLLVTYDVPIVGHEASHMFGGLTHVLFARITALITVYITVERYLSIMIPLKVKQIITPKKTTIILCIIFTIMILVFVPEYATSYMDWRFDEYKNKTVFGIIYRENRSSVDGLTYILFSLLGAISFVAVVIITMMLVFQLKQTSKWRMAASNDESKLQTISNRERRAVTMVVMIATVLIVCYLPGAAVSMATFIEPEFCVAGVNTNIYYVSWSFVFVFDSINSSINIILYYRMSSKYRETFHRVFGISCAQK